MLSSGAFSRREPECLLQQSIAVLRLSPATGKGYVLLWLLSTAQAHGGQEGHMEDLLCGTWMLSPGLETSES